MGGRYRWVRPDERGGSRRGCVRGRGCGSWRASWGVRRGRCSGSGCSRRWRGGGWRIRCVGCRLMSVSGSVAGSRPVRATARSLGRWVGIARRSVGRFAPVAVGGVSGVAAERGERRARRPKPGKLARSPRLLAAVEAGLERRWSPQQISARLRLEYPDDMGMRVSHETIYQSLFVQARGELRRQLDRACCGSGRATRRRQGRARERGRIPDMVSIAERPAEVDDRAVPGHWEGDLLARRQQPLGDRHAGGAPDPLCAAGSPRSDRHAPSASIDAIAERIAHAARASGRAR